jgi:transposase InsO family protein
VPGAAGGAKLRSEDVLAALAELFVTRGPPAHIRSDNGPEFIANAVQEWLAKIGVKTLYITPGSPWENGYCESFNGSMRDELLERGDLLHPGRGPDPDRSLAAALQHRQAAQLAGLSTAGPGSGYAAMAALRFRFAPPTASHGAGGSLALTINTDHSVGAGHEY